MRTPVDGGTARAVNRKRSSTATAGREDIEDYLAVNSAMLAAELDVARAG
jgi:hypothetical protein